jgi:hypothetical protein
MPYVRDNSVPPATVPRAAAAGAQVSAECSRHEAVEPKAEEGVPTLHTGVLVLETANLATALAQIAPLAGVQALLAGLMPRARGRELLDSVATSLETAAAVSRDVTRKAGSVIKETAQDPETQLLVLKGATVAAREFGFLLGGSIGGRIVERIGEVVGGRLQRSHAGESGDRTPPEQTEAPHDETQDQSG